MPSTPTTQDPSSSVSSGDGRTSPHARPSLRRRVANLRSIADLPRMLARVHGEGSPVARLDAGPFPLAYLHRPATIKAVLDGKVDGVAERGRFFEDISRVIGSHSLVTCQGDEHRQLRRLLAVAFRPEHVARYAETMAAATNELVAGFADSATLWLGESMSRLTLEIAARALLGLAHAEQLDDFATVLETGTKLFYRLLLPRRLSDALWKSRLSPANRRLGAAQRTVDRFVDALVSDRRAAMDLGSTGSAGADSRLRPSNLVDVLLAAEGGGQVGSDVVRDQIVTFLFAGHETTAQALTWCFVLLDRNPKARVRLEAELDTLCDAPSTEDLLALRFCRAVVREALRLYPPAWFLARETTNDTVIDGCPLPKGTLLLSSPLAFQRDPEAFCHPDAFEPERWLIDGQDAALFESYLPFGHGRRNCIGSSFAMAELVIVVATVARAWRLRVLEPDRVRARPTVTLRPRRSVQVVLERRPSRSGATLR